jgi:hypothetical protein
MYKEFECSALHFSLLEYLAKGDGKKYLAKLLISESCDDYLDLSSLRKDLRYELRLTSYSTMCAISFDYYRFKHLSKISSGIDKIYWPKMRKERARKMRLTKRTF